MASAILGSIAAVAAHSFLTERPLLQTSSVRRLASFGALLALGGTLACYQETPAPRAQSGQSAGVASLGLQPLPASHDTAIREIDRFELTTEALQRLAAAKRNVSALYARDPGIDARMRGTAAPKNLDEMAARIDADPGMRDAMKQAGLTARGYMVSMVALQQAVKGFQLKTTGKLDTSKVPPTVMANINFVATHMPEIMQMMMASGPRAPAR